jgi:hypothetical protein
MDLRAQLAAHEAELTQLKRKWERIVARGLERQHGPTASISSAPAARAPANADMLDGFREGVQGVGRLLVAGLADLTSGSGASPVSASPHSAPASAAAAAAVVPQRQAGRPSPAVYRALAHNPTGSTSSTATASTARSSAGTSARFSQSSASSVESGLGEEECVPVAMPANGRTESEERAARVLRRRSREAPVEASGAGAPEAKRPAQGSLADVSDWARRRLDGDATKRASVLFADVGQSLFGALTSPGATSPASPSSAKTRPPVLAVHGSSHPGTSVVGSRKAGTAAATGRTSLLDDDEEDAWAALGAGDVLVPDARPTPVLAPARAASAMNPTAQGGPHAAKKDDFDDWNWWAREGGILGLLFHESMFGWIGDRGA